MLEDLFLTHYRAEKINGDIVVIEDSDGRYRANSSDEVRKALTENKPITTVVDVLIGRHWKSMGIR